MKILLADDERGIRLTLAEDLEDAGHEVVAVEDGELAIRELKKQKFDCLISDVVMPKVDGMSLLRFAREQVPDIIAIMITGNATVERALEAMKLGAKDFVEKPFNNEKIVLLLNGYGESQQTGRKYQKLVEEVKTDFKVSQMVGNSPQMKRLYEDIKTVAESEFSVLIRGENGTGKEVIATTLHQLSPRQKGPLIKVACHISNVNLLEDELFGHEPGAFTGATSRRIGRFEQAMGGTIYLDDIDDMPVDTQAKLLRVLQEREIERLGGDHPIKVDIHVIASTKVDLRDRVREGKFREDLYHRINVIDLHVPPLREREGDIPVLVEHFLQRYAPGRALTIAPEAMAALVAYRWPGNVRELQHAVQRAIAFGGAGGVLKKEHFLRDFKDALPEGAATITPGDDRRPLKEVVAAAEKAHILNVMRMTRGKVDEAAGILGISRKNLWEKRKQYGLLDGETE
ncbi:MAG: sigma-54-dependent Fis family transcriptional regulator [Planctomycetes bacterium]|jgi:DNA-binding NtrC family response regulator|nr:sigma-54-dependent Fis family transcriptional regulator [Planctomycetota bacterium]MCL4729425.1 sigma-54 dependent transcriptional regulator [Planctomycetota bacterium]